MFYLYLVLFSFIESYFFYSINQFILNGSIILSDFVFSIICLVPAFLIVLSSLHVKHLNSQNLKKVGFGIIGIGWVYFLITCFSFNFTSILIGFETALIFSLAGYLIYYYQTVPEGEPDVEVEDEESQKLNYYPETDYLDEYELVNFNSQPEDDYSNQIIKPEIEKLKETLNSITEIEDLDISLNQKVENIKNQVIQIDTANSEYKSDNLNDIILIFQILLDNLINGDSENDKLNEIQESFDLISKNLENIYYNTRGAQVYRNQNDLNKLAQKLEN